MTEKKEIVISLKDVNLNIPIFCKTELSIKKSFIKAVTGSKISNKNNNTFVTALNSINIDIYRGDKIALIGHNGSGKSSFIRLISKIYSPSSGNFISKVSVFPMLTKSFIVSEALTGIDEAKAHYLSRYFNLNGFENYLDEIVEFSGLGDFIALPLKTYSEGMANRLLFTLLTFDKYDFLALDEGIGTGDNAFHEKASKRLDKFISESGSLVFASHSNELLKRFCTRGIVFSCGSIVYDGKLKDAISYYAESNQ